MRSHGAFGDGAPTFLAEGTAGTRAPFITKTTPKGLLWRLTGDVLFVLYQNQRRGRNSDRNSEGRAGTLRSVRQGWHLVGR